MVQLIMQHDAAHETVEELGELGTLMFVDLNEGAALFKRNFMPELKLCDETGRHLRAIREEVLKASVLVGNDCGGSGGHFGELAELRTLLAEHASELRELHRGEKELVTNYSQLCELSHVLQKCDDIFSRAQQSDSEVVPHSSREVARAEYASGGAPRSAMDEALGETRAAAEQRRPSTPGGGLEMEGGSSSPFDLEGGLELDSPTGQARLCIAPCIGGGNVRLCLPPTSQARLGFVAGVIEVTKLQPFERMLFRATRGNVYFHSIACSIDSIA